MCFQVVYSDSYLFPMCFLFFLIFLAEWALKAVSEHVRLSEDKPDTFNKIKQCAVENVLSKNTGPTPWKSALWSRATTEAKTKAAKGKSRR